MLKPFRFLTTLLFVFALLTSGSITFAQNKTDSNKKENPGYIFNGKIPGRPGDTGFLTSPKQGDPYDIALEYLRKNVRQLGLTEADLNDFVISDQYSDDHNGVTHIYLRQRINGIEVSNGDLSINISANGSVINIGHSFVTDLATALNRRNPGLTASQAVSLAARHLGLPLKGTPQVLENAVGDDQTSMFDSAGISMESIPARLVYQPVGPNSVRLAWLLEIQELTGDHWWSMAVDAESGEVLAQVDYVDHDEWGPPSLLLFNGPLPLPRKIPAKPKTTGIAALVDGASYNVFAMPLESPNDGDRTLVTNPAHSTASPFGWHDTNGVAGAEFTHTRGNNVHAYTDIVGNNPTNPPAVPDGGPGLVFDFPLDLNQNPSEYRPAAVVNLFYWNNIIHDVFYGYGFNEVSGNFQVNNYGRGPIPIPPSTNFGANDDVRAEAQDGSGTNNANMATGVDGSRPRMQMFVWTSPFANVVTVNPTSPIEGDYGASAAAFGPTLTTTGPKTADVVLALDPGDAAGPSTTDACSPLTNAAAVSGKIAILDRGTCAFVIKVKNAQNAGAIAVIVANNAAGNPGTLGGADATITIPSVMVSLAVGDSMKTNLPLNATLSVAGATINRDSDLDNGVIVHEYGHGISNRLTGGRLVSGGLSNQEQMGEGWSDFLGLVLTTSLDDTATTNRGIGTYVNYEPADGRGIRPTAYTTNMTVNPSTYDTIKTAAVPHGVGYVWSTMLWEVYWNLVNKHGYNPDVYGNWTTGGNNLAIQLVIDGLKLQPTQPGFVTGRNAIISADLTLTDGANKCEIWQGFAKRGLGVSATQGSSNSVADGVQAFNLPPECVPTLTLATPAAVQYSDPISLSASVSPLIFSGLPVTGSVEFFIDGASVGSSPVNGSGVASLTVSNNRASGSYNVTATFTADSPAGVNPSNSGPVSLTVNKEIAATTYTGDLFVTTAGPKFNSAPVTLSANMVEQDDGNSGDISLAKASFELFKSSNMGSTPDLTVGNVSVDSSGNAAVVVNLGDDTWTVKVKVDSANTYWTASPVGMDLITVVVPSDDRRVTGGGWVPVANTSNGKANFGFTVAPMKNNGNLKGNAVFVIRGIDGFDYHVKSNSWQGGSLIFLGNPIINARFNGRANVKKIDPATGDVVESFGNYTFTVEIRDGDLMNPAGPDAYGITILNGSGEVFFQVGGTGAPVNLGGGNVGIKSQ